MNRRQVLAGVATCAVLGGQARAATDGLHVDGSVVLSRISDVVINGSVRLDDGGVLLYGQSESGADEPFVVETGPDGTHRWTAVPKMDSPRSLVMADKVDDDELVGVFDRHAWNQSDVVVARFGTGGVVRSERVLPEMPDASFVDAAPLEAGYFVVVERYTGTDNQKLPRREAVLVDARGRVLSRSDIAPERSVTPTGVFDAGDGSVLVGGSIDRGSSGAVGWLARFDGTERRWARILDTSGLSTVLDVYPEQDGFVVCGAALDGASERSTVVDTGLDGATGQSTAVVTRLDPTGDEQWAVRYSPDDDVDVRPATVAPSPVGGYLVGGTRETEAVTEGHVFSVAADGSTVTGMDIGGDRFAPDNGNLRSVDGLLAQGEELVAVGVTGTRWESPVLLSIAEGAPPNDPTATPEEIGIGAVGLLGTLGAGWAVVRQLRR